MAQHRIADPEELLECPYERSHMVRAKRFQYHLVKCRKSYTGKDFQTCPFNAKHHIPKPEYRHHMATCPDQVLIEQDLSYANSQDRDLKGCTDTPVYRDLHIDMDEDWDAEITAPVKVGPAYDSTYYDRVKFKDISSMTKQQRAIVSDNRLSTEQKMEELRQFDRGDAPVNGSTLRLPNTPSMVTLGMQQQQQQVKPVSSSFAHQAARGRGRGVAAPQVGALANGTVVNGNVSQPPVSAWGNVPAGRGMGVGRGMVFNGGVGRGSVAPPPGFCIPKMARE